MGGLRHSLIARASWSSRFWEDTVASDSTRSTVPLYTSYSYLVVAHATVFTPSWGLTTARGGDPAGASGEGTTLPNTTSSACATPPLRSSPTTASASLTHRLRVKPSTRAPAVSKLAPGHAQPSPVRPWAEP